MCKTKNITRQNKFIINMLKYLLIGASGHDVQADRASSTCKVEHSDGIQDAFLPTGGVGVLEQVPFAHIHALHAREELPPIGAHHTVVARTHWDGGDVGASSRLGEEGHVAHLQVALDERVGLGPLLRDGLGTVLRAGQHVQGLPQVGVEGDGLPERDPVEPEPVASLRLVVGDHDLGERVRLG